MCTICKSKLNYIFFGAKNWKRKLLNNLYIYISVLRPIVSVLSEETAGVKREQPLQYVEPFCFVVPLK